MELTLGKLERFVPRRVKSAGWMRPRYPLVGIELREDGLVVARLSRRKGQYDLAGHSRVSFPPGTLTCAMMRCEVGDPEALAGAVGEGLRLAGAEGAGKISLALPDTAARAFVVDFQELPSGREQIGNMIRWRLKKSVPFAIDGARLAWEELGQADDGRIQLLVTLAPDEGLRELERVFEGAGLRPGLIDLASFSTFNALRLEGLLEHGGPGDVALLSATPTYFSLMIFRAERLIFYRAKSYHVQGGFQGEESLRVVARELRTSLSYYEEHLLGEGVSRVLTRVASIDPEGIVGVVRDAGCERVEPAELRRVVPALAAAPADELPELLPAVGLALRRES